jgi:ATP-dependent helicase HrpA
VLVFLPGEREIRDAAEALRKHHPPHVEILPLFARLSARSRSASSRPAMPAASCWPPTWPRPR